MFDKTRTYASFNLAKLGLLPNNWQNEILEVAKDYGYLTHLDGKSSTSREPENSEGSDVFVVEGDVIFSKLSWLHNLYSTELLNLANTYFGNDYETANNLISGTNINFLKGFNARYEWHVDSNPLTGVLFVNTLDETDGGELVFKLKDEIIIVHPQSGMFILFDAREIPHAVNPLKVDSYRISVPMNYYLKSQRQQRPEDLDGYIYKK